MDQSRLDEPDVSRLGVYAAQELSHDVLFRLAALFQCGEFFLGDLVLKSEIQLCPGTGRHNQPRFRLAVLAVEVLS